MKLVPDKLMLDVSRKVLVAKKQSPHIFFVLGVAGSVASTVLACRATLNVSKTLDEIQNDILTTKEMKPEIGAEDVYTIEEYYKDTVYVYSKAGFKLVRLYGPSAIVGIASIGALAGSHVQLTRRNSALMAAYALVQKAYDDYRDRVRDEVGEKRELDLYHAVQTQSIKDENEKKKEVKTADPNKWSPYARFFDEVSRHWEKEPELNRLYIQCQQNYANNLLQARGHIFLNEVYDMLDIERSSAGAVVGWVIGTEGDNYIDFGIFEAYNSRFINGRERSILLDFNVDGVIYDKI